MLTPTYNSEVLQKMKIEYVKMRLSYMISIFLNRNSFPELEFDTENIEVALHDFFSKLAFFVHPLDLSLAPFLIAT